jgi:hypothetical protein
MNERLARAALALYPLAFRRRYGDEIGALLEDQRPGLRAVADLFRGAIRAHLRPRASTAGYLSPEDRVRLSGSGVLVSWVLFAAVGLGFYKTTEDYPFRLAGHAHPLLRVSHLAVQAAALVGSAAVVLGALPLMAIAVSRARVDPNVRCQVVRALLPVAVFAGLTALLVVIAQADRSPHTSVAGGVAVIVWSLAGLACGVLCASACRAALFAVAVPTRWLGRILLAGAVVWAAMLVVTIASGVYAVGLTVSEPALAGGWNGPLQFVTTSLSLILQTAAMAVLCALGAVTWRRGWAVRADLGSPVLE